MGKTEILLRQVKEAVKGVTLSEEKNKDSVPLSKLRSLASGGDMVYYYSGCLSALLTGVFMPSSILMFGDAVNSFGAV
jgi:hypothetical protein